VNTLSEAGVQVVLITDACRSGKLAGTDNGGTKATAAALAQQFANEIKILSCQPEEYSLEGRQWGGGRGVFSYHLVDALTGMADGNADGLVSLMETARYLEDRVPADTDPHQQIPMTVGSRGAVLASVLPEALADLQKRKQAPTLEAIDAKGFEDLVLAKADSSVQRLYAAFTAALERGELLAPRGACANDFYLQLLPKPGIEKLKGLMTRNLAAALQDEAQVVINQILRTDPQIVDDAFSPVARYDHLPAYLSRAAALLGEQHYMWRFLKAREYYFSAKTCRKENYPELTPDSLLNLALARLDTALLFDDEAAYAWFEKGYLLFWSGGQAKTFLEYFEKASMLSDEWLMARYYVGRTLTTFESEVEKGVAILQQVLAKDSLFLPAYREIGFITDDKIWFEAYVLKMQEYERVHPGKLPAIYYNYLGSCLMGLQRNEEAVPALLQGAKLSNDQLPQIYINLGRAYRALERYEDAEKAYRKGIELSPLVWQWQMEIATLLILHSKAPVDSIKPYFVQIVQLKPADDSGWFMLTCFFLKNGQLDSAENTLRQWLTYSPENNEPHLLLAHTYKLAGKYDEARKALQKALIDCGEDPASNCEFDKLIAFKALGITDSFDLLQRRVQEAIQAPAFYNSFLIVVYAFNDQNSDALACFENSFQQGGKLTDPTLTYALLHPATYSLQQTPEFKALVKKYFPDKVKD
jgi:tetratricopeptide (TPR) repeat protein